MTHRKLVSEIEELKKNGVGNVVRIPSSVLCIFILFLLERGSGRRLYFGPEWYQFYFFPWQSESPAPVLISTIAQLLSRMWKTKALLQHP